MSYKFIFKSNLNARKVQKGLCFVSISFFHVEEVIENFHDFVIRLMSLIRLVCDGFCLADGNFFEAFRELLPLLSC